MPCIALSRLLSCKILAFSNGGRPAELYKSPLKLLWIGNRDVFLNIQSKNEAENFIADNRTYSKILLDCDGKILYVADYLFYVDNPFIKFP